MLHRPILNAVNDFMHDQGIEPLNDAQANFFTCLIAAAIAHLPAIIGDVMICMAKPNPPTGGYDPGDRTRCAA